MVAVSVALTAGALIAPRATRAQPAERVRRIGWLSETAGMRPTFSEALRELGWVEGRNISFETHNTQVSASGRLNGRRNSPRPRSTSSSP